jgi:hypothetical protein
VAKLLTLTVQDGVVYRDGHEVRPGVPLQTAWPSYGTYEVGEGSLRRFAGSGYLSYTYEFPGDGVYRFGPHYGHKLIRRPDESDDPGKFYHGSESPLVGCISWTHWFTMTRRAKECFLEFHPGQDHSIDWRGKRVDHPEIIYAGSGHWEWMATLPPGEIQKLQEVEQAKLARLKEAWEREYGPVV